MKTLLAMAMGLMGSASALAQAVPLPLEGIGGRPVPAHYARLEGSGASQTLFRILKAHQEGCAKLGKAVDLPPEGAPVSKITRDDYYTATHLIEFRREEVLSIDSNCALSWQAQTPRLIVISPQGACTLYVEKRMALGVWPRRTQRAHDAASHLATRNSGARQHQKLCTNGRANRWISKRAVR
jgi:hypothetical protein